MLYDTRRDRTTEVGDLLNRAADLIEKHGHTKHTLVNKEDGSMCFMGAMYQAHSSAWTYDPAMIEAVEITARMLKLRYDGGYETTALRAVVDWNNHPDRTGAEVIAAMRAAAVIANKKEKCHAI